MKIKTANEEYIEKAKLLTEEEAERLQSRMRDKLHRRLEDKKLNTIEAIAIQLEFEDEQLNEWRERVVEVREKFKDKKPKEGGDKSRTSIYMLEFSHD